jgi:oxygen-independent coproporphyrinogen-3 oxidase
LLKEIELSKNYLNNEPIETLYLGGGTPSLLSANEITEIVDTLRTYYNLDNLLEFTIEANPDDLDEQKVKEFGQLKSLGLNRFSIGVQSFFDTDLIYMNRAHRAAEALNCIKRVQDAGFEKVTIDLIYGTPTMPDEHWMENLSTAFGLGIPHISSYALTVEPKTTLENKIIKGQLLPVADEQSARQFRILMNEMKKAGYEQYEISNFATPGNYAIHNTNYWRGKKYLGLGPSAHSYNNTARRWNVANNINYINSVNKGIIPAEQEILTEAQKVNEFIMTSLRTMWGLPLKQLKPEHLNSVMRDLENTEPSYYHINHNHLVLTDAGKLFADAIAASLFIGEQQF